MRCRAKVHLALYGTGVKELHDHVNEIVQALAGKGCPNAAVEFKDCHGGCRDVVLTLTLNTETPEAAVLKAGNLALASLPSGIQLAGSIDNIGEPGPGHKP